MNCLWSPAKKDMRNFAISRFMDAVYDQTGKKLQSFNDLHQWSIENMETFWSMVWDFCGVIGDKGPGPYLLNLDSIKTAEFFPHSHLNYAENILKRRDAETAIFFWAEDRIKRTLSFKEIYDQVSRLAQHFKKMGLKKGDRVAAYVPNTPETIIAMLATSAIGAIWSSCSPDFGVESVLDRFQQINPKILIAADGYIYKGVRHSYSEKIAALQKSLTFLEQTILYSYEGESATISDPLLPASCVSFDSIQKTYAAQDIIFERFPFNTPLFIMFSSGTTGVPKCIVHGAGGTLLQHLKEHQLHCNIEENDRIFYFTTCGWMMWNWQVSALASNASLALYDGFPFAPTITFLLDYVDAIGITLFGTSAKYLESLGKRDISVQQTYSLKTLKDITSTGSPLSEECFEYVYSHIKSDIRLSSISGGTDIISCFVLGNPISAIYAGEIQGPGLGMAIEIFDEMGKPIAKQKGELVCTKPFPSMPIGFWNDAKQEKYNQAYFSHFPNVWYHGDFAELTQNKGFIIHGRSDAVLNPGGVRIGTAEIYRQIEKIKEIQECIAVGHQQGNDIRVILFVKMQNEKVLDKPLIDHIKNELREKASPRHVPALILQTPDIPKTKNGKLVEIAVRDILHGKEIHNKEALLNPESLEYFKEITQTDFKRLK